MRPTVALSTCVHRKNLKSHKLTEGIHYIVLHVSYHLIVVALHIEDGEQCKGKYNAIIHMGATNDMCERDVTGLSRQVIGFIESESLSVMGSPSPTEPTLDQPFMGLVLRTAYSSVPFT